MKTIIKLVVNEVALDIGNDIISHTLYNPYLYNQGSHSLPFSIPDTEKNREALSISHDIHDYGYTRAHDAELHAGMYTISGKFIIDKTENGRIFAHLLSSKGSFFDLAAGTYLTDLDHTDDIGVTDTYFSPTWLDAITLSAESSYPTYNYVFAPVYMPAFQEAHASDVTKTINYFDLATQKFVYKTGGIYVSGNCYAPFYYVCFVISKVFEYFGYTIDENEFYDNTELRQTVIFHTNLQNRIFRYITFEKFLPKMLCSDFIRAIESKFNMRFDINEQNRIVKLRFRNNVMNETNIEDITDQAEPAESIDIPAFDGFTLINGIDENNPFISDNSPEMDEGIDNAYFDYNVVNLDDISTPAEGDIALISGDNSIYKYIYDKDTSSYSWEYIGRAVVDYTDEGDNKYEEKIDCGHLIMDEPSGHTDVKLVARNDIDRSLKVLEHIKPKQARNLSIMFYRGKIPFTAVYSVDQLPDPGVPNAYCFVHLQMALYQYLEVAPGAGVYAWDPIDETWPMDEDAYPLLTDSIYYVLTDGSKIALPNATLELNLFGSNGLYENFFKDWLYWYVNFRKVERRRINFNPESFSSILWDKKYRIKNQNYILGKINIRIDFANQRIEFGETELHSVH